MRVKALKSLAVCLNHESDAARGGGLLISRRQQTATRALDDLALPVADLAVKPPLW
jgi:hypothetical protein